MATYRLGAQKTVRPQSTALGRGRSTRGAAQRVPDVNYPCHAVDDDGDAVCGYTGSFATLDEPDWDADSLISRCPDCERLLEPLP